MADFRKLLLALIVGCLLFTTVASAVDYKCTASSVPTLIRAEGLAEYVGDVKLTCGGTPPPNGIQVNIRMTLSANVTSNPLTTLGSPTILESTMVLDKGADGFRGYATASGTGSSSGTNTLTPASGATQNLYQAVKISDTEIEWQGVILAASGSSGVFTEVLMTNVRANAGGVANAPISATINITTPTSVTIDNNSLVVANTRTGMTFSVRSASGGSTVPQGMKSCVGMGYGSSDSCAIGFQGRFVEGFNNAFRPKNNNLEGAPYNPHSYPGGGYADERGFMPPGLAAGSLINRALIGEATQGTRLVMRVKGVPSGIVLGVPLSITTTNGLVLYYSVVTAGDFGQGYPASASSVFTCKSTKDSKGVVTLLDGASLGDVALDASGNGVVVYEVSSYGSGATAPSLADTVSVPFYMGYSKTTVGIGTAKLSGNFAPISTVTTTSSVAPEPRFLDSATDADVLTIGLCRTLLLFPYITNAAGFDTGIAISNTTADPMLTTAQAGTCSLNYYGNTNGSTGPVAQTSPSVGAGGQLIMLLSSGGSVYAKDGGPTACASGNCLAPAFTGYMIAICNFQFAHGYAFISDLGAQKLAQGYLALVIPDRGVDKDNRKPQNAACGSASVSVSDGKTDGISLSGTVGCSDSNLGEQLAQ